MAKTENTAKPTAREKLLSLAREHYPDRKFAEPGTEPGEGIADLDEAIDEMLTSYATKQAEYDEKNSKLTELIITDPSAAEFIQSWVETGDPRTALVKTFGDELGMNEESRNAFKAELDVWRERKSANDKLESEAEDNWQASLAALDEWGDGKSLSLEQKRDVMLRLLAITFNGMENKYSVEDFDLALNAINHDSDVAAARQEGEVAGRNTKIAAARRERNASAAMPPAPVGGQGGSVRERGPVNESKSVWAGVK